MELVVSSIESGPRPWFPFVYPCRLSMQWVLYDKDGAAQGVVVCMKKMELHTRKLLLRCLSALVHIQNVLPPSCCLKVEGPQNGSHRFWPQSGGVEEKGPTIQSQLVDPALKNCVLLMISHPIVPYIFSAGLYCRLEDGICETSVIRPVGSYPGPMGGCQALVSFLDPKGFLK